MAVLVVLIVGCGGSDNSPPSIAPIPDQPGAVGQPLEIALRASDPDGDRVTFSVKPDNKDILSRSQLLNGGGGAAVWKWVPIGADVGPHKIDFIASDGKDSAHRSVNVVINSAAGGLGSPVFRKPLGTGTTLDLSKNDCAEVPVVVDDADSPQVTLLQEPPLI